jgi:hypothetical protein
VKKVRAACLLQCGKKRSSGLRWRKLRKSSAADNDEANRMNPVSPFMHQSIRRKE